MQVAQFADNATCHHHNACVFPQADLQNAHDVIWYNLTQAQCEDASYGVSLYFTQKLTFVDLQLHLWPDMR
jgi:hypothetical protein